MYAAHSPSSTRGGKLNITKIGTWSSENGYDLVEYQTKLESRRDFHGITFKGVVTVC